MTKDERRPVTITPGDLVFGGWEGKLLAAGYTVEEIAQARQNLLRVGARLRERVQRGFGPAIEGEVEDGKS